MQIQKLRPCLRPLQHESQRSPYIFQDAGRPQPALVQDVLWDVIPKIQDVILAHKHDKLLIVGTQRLVAMDESLDEPELGSVMFVF